MNIPSRTLWTNDFLNQKRLVGDPLADTTISAVMTLGLKGEMDQFFRLLVQNDSYETLAKQGFAGFSPALIQAIDPFFKESGQTPAELADPFELNNAVDGFKDQLVPILLTLHCKSLPLSYACANGAKVLHQAGRMVVHDQSLKPFTRRLLETAQFVRNVLSENGFEPAGNAIISVQKVRLMHAAIRFYTKLRPWDVATFGEPINQEDLALGHLIFSSVIISGLRKFGIDVSKNQVNCYLYLWRRVAHTLGIQPDLVAQTQEDGEYMLDRIMDRQAKPSKEGAALTYACIEFVDGKLNRLPIKRLTPRLMRFLIGDTYARMLQIPGTPGPSEKANPADFGLISTLFPKWDAFNERNLLFKAAGRFFLDSSTDLGLKMYNSSLQEQFFVPASLSDYLDQQPPVALAAGPASQSLADAMKQLDTLTRLLKTFNSPLGLFTIACRELAKRIADPASRKPFVHEQAMQQCYRQSLNLFFAEVNHSGKGEAVAGPWHVVFQSEKKLLTIDQHILLAGYAHLAYDFIGAIAAQVPAAELVGFRSDYYQLITLFTAIYMELIEQLGHIHPDYGWLAGLLFEPARESIFGVFREGVTNAWDFTAQLTAPGIDQAAARQEHGLAAVTFADHLVNPTDSSVDKLMELAQRQFPPDQPDQSAAAKIDALLARNKN